jgi:hypothetical protein
MKKVNLPINVPSGSYCWERKHEICGHFSNEGGHATCSLGFNGQAEVKNGVLKDPKCNSLHEAMFTKHLWWKRFKHKEIR